MSAFDVAGFLKAPSFKLAPPKRDLLGPHSFFSDTVNGNPEILSDLIKKVVKTSEEPTVSAQLAAISEKFVPKSEDLLKNSLKPLKLDLLPPASSLLTESSPAVSSIASSLLASSGDFSSPPSGAPLPVCLKAPSMNQSFSMMSSVAASPLTESSSAVSSVAPSLLASSGDFSPPSSGAPLPVCLKAPSMNQSFPVISPVSPRDPSPPGPPPGSILSESFESSNSSLTSLLSSLPERDTIAKASLVGLGVLALFYGAYYLYQKTSQWWKSSSSSPSEEAAAKPLKAVLNKEDSTPSFSSVEKFSFKRVVVIETAHEARRITLKVHEKILRREAKNPL